MLISCISLCFIHFSCRPRTFYMAAQAFVGSLLIFPQLFLTGRVETKKEWVTHFCVSPSSVKHFCSPLTMMSSPQDWLTLSSHSHWCLSFSAALPFNLLQSFLLQPKLHLEHIVCGASLLLTSFNITWNSCWFTSDAIQPHVVSLLMVTTTLCSLALY